VLQFLSPAGSTLVWTNCARAAAEMANTTPNTTNVDCMRASKSP
jgi:hypothetical protein